MVCVQNCDQSVSHGLAQVDNTGGAVRKEGKIHFSLATVCSRGGDMSITVITKK